MLAGRATLAARDLIEACRVAALPIDRVFLAACATNAVGNHHDEAFSLAAAFLEAGVHTVFGTLWPVRDEETSLFMCLVHHHLNVDGCAPSEALHRAQRWMLDPRGNRLPGCHPSSPRAVATARSHFRSPGPAPPTSGVEAGICQVI